MAISRGISTCKSAVQNSDLDSLPAYLCSKKPGPKDNNITQELKKPECTRDAIGMYSLQVFHWDKDSCQNLLKTICNVHYHCKVLYTHICISNQLVVQISLIGLP